MSAKEFLSNVPNVLVRNALEKVVETLEADNSLTEVLSTAPLNAVAAALTTNLTGATNNDMVFTAKTKGVVGNAITMKYTAPAAGGALAVAVSGTDINVTLAGTAAVAASGTITIAAGNVSGDDGIAIGDTTYVFKAALTDPAAANEVLIGLTNATATANLVAAINGAAGVGTTYSTGTLANTSVTAAAAAGVITVTAKTAGAAGNAIVLTKNADNVTLDPTDDSLGGGSDASTTITTIASAVKTAIEATPAAHALISVANAASNNGSGLVAALAKTALAGGVDGTVAPKGTMKIADDKLYIAVDDNTIATTNWKYASLT